MDNKTIAAKVFEEVNEKLDKLLCQNKSEPKSAENNNSEMLKMLDFCLTLMEVKDRKFNVALKEVTVEVDTLKSQLCDAMEMIRSCESNHGKPVHEHELKGKMETKNENPLWLNCNVETEIGHLKKTVGEQHEEMKNFWKQYQTQKEEIEKTHENQVSTLQNQFGRLETGLKDTLIEKMSLVDSKISKIEKEFAKKMPELNEMMIKSKIFQIERYKIFPVPQVNSAGLPKEFIDEPPVYLWKIPNMHKKLNLKAGVHVSDVFPLHGYQLNAWAQMKNKDSHTFVIKLILEDADQSKQILNLSLHPRVFVLLKDQSQSEDCQNIIRTTFKPFNAKQSSALNYYSVSFKSSELSAPSYNTANSISLAFYVESIWQTRHVYSYDGSLFWTIDDYWTRKEMVKRKLLFCHLSPYFYTSPLGYRVQMHIYLNGCDKFTNKGLSVGISFQNGEADSQLGLSFHHKTTVTIFNPSNPAKNVTKSAENTEIKKLFYYIDMASHDVVESLLENGVLFYKVTIVKM